MGEKTTLISSFYSFEPFVPAAHAYSPSHIILLIDKFMKKEDSEKVQANIEKVREMYGSVASVEVVRVDAGDLLATAERTARLLEETEGRKIVNASGGAKLLAQGIIYGCYARPELVEKIVCTKPGETELVELPKLSYGLTGAKKALLVEIARKDGRGVAEIARKMRKTRGMVYVHLKELKEAGYVDEKFEITLAGRMAVL